MKCQYIYDPEYGKAWIPGCTGGAIRGPKFCTCRNRELTPEQLAKQADKKLIKELEQENARLNRIIKKLISTKPKKKGTK